MFVIAFISVQNVPPVPPCEAGKVLGADGKCHYPPTFIKEKGPINQGLGQLMAILNALAAQQAAKKLPSAKKIKAAFPKPSTPSTGEGVG